MKSARILSALMLAILFLSNARPARAVGSGGFTSQMVDAKAFGMGNAFAATADDGSAIFFNPAGLVQIQSSEISGGLSVVLPKTSYTGDAGINDNTEKTTTLLANAYYSTPLLDGKAAVGVGGYQPFGYESHWPQGGPLRYVATDSQLRVLDVNPAFAYQITDQVLVGAGVIGSVANATDKSQLNVSFLNSSISGQPVIAPDGEKEFSGTGLGGGANAGVLFKPGGNQSVGLSYRSPITISLKGNEQLLDMSGASAALFGIDSYQTDAQEKLYFPQSATAGYAYHPGRWTFEGDAEWVNYSAMKETPYDFSSESNPGRLAVLNAGNPVPRQWKDSWNTSLGVNCVLNAQWQVRAGVFHTPSVVPSATWDPSLPESSNTGFTLGGSYTEDNFTAELAYGFIHSDERTVNNGVGSENGGSVDGSYSTQTQVISANITYRP